MYPIEFFIVATAYVRLVALDGVDWLYKMRLSLILGFLIVGRFYILVQLITRTSVLCRM